MSLLLDKKYIDLISYRFDKFKWKSGTLANARCPLCGDSENKRKKRGYFYVKEGRYLYYCHNCGPPAYQIKSLLKRLDHKLYSEYCFEELNTGQSYVQEVTKTNLAMKFDHGPYMDYLKSLKKISQLPHDHYAKKYIVERKIPNPYHSILRFSPNFWEWTKTLVPDKIEEGNKYPPHEDRIIIPFFSEDNKFFAYTGRSLDKSKKQGARYALIILNHDIPLIYGLNTMDRREKIYAVEGQFDAMFIPNSISLSGSNLNVLTNLDECDNFVVVFDNEPHSHETKKKVLQAIDLGYKCCIWPKWVESKDINQMVIDNSWGPVYIKEVIDANTFSGIEAKIRLEQWSMK